MNKNNNKKTIYCIYGIIVLCLTTSNVPAFGQVRLEDTIFNRKPEDKYKLRNAEIIFLITDSSHTDVFNTLNVVKEFRDRTRVLALNQDLPDSVKAEHIKTICGVPTYGLTVSEVNQQSSETLLDIFQKSIEGIQHG